MYSKIYGFNGGYMDKNPLEDYNNNSLLTAITHEADSYTEIEHEW